MVYRWSGLVRFAGGAFFILLAVLVFAKPATAERFLLRFASSAPTHYAEQILRVLLGGSLVAHSVAMWQPHVWRLVGWAIVVSSLGLMIVPRRWHHRFGQKVLPVLVRHMRLYGIGMFAFGAVILYAMFAPHLGGPG